MASGRFSWPLETRHTPLLCYQTIIVALGALDVCDGAHRLIVMKEIRVVSLQDCKRAQRSVN